jgi:hypothetical protein
MNARVVAETPPVISSMTPKSQVINETVDSGKCHHRNLGLKVPTQHRCKQNSCCEEYVSLHVERLVREEILLDDLNKISVGWRRAMAGIPLCIQTTPAGEW